MILPRQARDKHVQEKLRETAISAGHDGGEGDTAEVFDTTTGTWSSVASMEASRYYRPTAVRETHIYLVRQFILERIILPRQARDKHRKS